MKPIVFVIKEQMLRNATGSNVTDYSPALKYGDLKFVTNSDIPLYPGSSVQLNWDSDVRSFIGVYDPTKDYIIATGSPTAIFEVGYRLGLAKKAPRFLVWRREDNEYRVLELNRT